MLHRTPAYRTRGPRALHDAFGAGCTTQTEANDVVVNYDLSGYAKNALKKYVPQLTTTYNAGELHDDHPVRFTNEGLPVVGNSGDVIQSAKEKAQT